MSPAISAEKDDQYVEGRTEQSARRALVYGVLGPKVNLNIVDELAAPEMLLQYSLHELRRGHEDIKAFMTGFRDAFTDLNFWGAPVSSY